MLKLISDGFTWRARRRSLHVIQLNLQQLQSMLAEAMQTELVVKTDEEKMFVSAISHHVASIQHSLDAFLES